MRPSHLSKGILRGGIQKNQEKWARTPLLQVTNFYGRWKLQSWPQYIGEIRAVALQGTTWYKETYASEDYKMIFPATSHHKGTAKFTCQVDHQNQGLLGQFLMVWGGVVPGASTCFT